MTTLYTTRSLALAALLAPTLLASASSSAQEDLALPQAPAQHATNSSTAYLLPIIEKQQAIIDGQATQITVLQKEKKALQATLAQHQCALSALEEQVQAQATGTSPTPTYPAPAAPHSRYQHPPRGRRRSTGYDHYSIRDFVKAWERIESRRFFVPPIIESP